MDKNELNSLIDKYLNGDCSSAELNRLMEFIRCNPMDEHMQNLIQSHWNNSTSPMFEEDKLQEAYQMSNLTLESIWRKEDRVQRWRIGSKGKWMLAAASVIALLTVGTWFWKYNTTEIPTKPEVVYMSYEPNTLKLPNGVVVAFNKDNKGNNVIWEDEVTKITQIEADEIQLIDKVKAVENRGELLLNVAKGKKVKLRFGDGTIAWINSDSQLKFPLRFGASSRLVDLSGEGYFEVSHAADRPFYVKGDKQLVQVYGTRFNIRSYQSEGKYSTTLYEGRLSVRRKLNKGYQDEQMLEPGDRFELHNDTEQVKLSTINKDQKMVEWMSDRIYYDEALLKEIFMDLSHKYVIEVDWANIPHLHFQGYLPVESDLDRILDVLSRTSNINIKRTNNKISFLTNKT